MEKITISNFMLALDRITKNTKRVIDTVLREQGLRSTHASCFFRICEAENGLSSTELAEACGVDKAFISRITNDLKKMGYVDYSSEEKTVHYKRKLFLTPSGNSIMSSVNEIITESVDRITSGISPEELEVFYSVISKFDNNLISLSE